MQQTSSLFQQANSDPKVRVVILSARGKAFSAGLDRNFPFGAVVLSWQVKDAQTTSWYTSTKGDPARTAKVFAQLVKNSQEYINSIASCTKPYIRYLCHKINSRVICVLHGAAIGIAIDISSACDIRIAAQDVKLSIKEVDIGIAADLGTLQRFPRIVANDSWTRELALTARFFGAKEALDKGFVSYVCESKDKGVEKAMEIAKVIAGKSPVAVQGTKALLDYSRDHSVREGMSAYSGMGY
jgi:delta(3,5)-delta(2,4)-dienoyl-CoA isomerase